MMAKWCDVMWYAIRHLFIAVAGEQRLHGANVLQQQRQRTDGTH